MVALCKRGFFAFSPVEYRRARVGRRRRPGDIEVRVALMPGYVFAKMAHGYCARGVEHVFAVVSMDGEPMPIPEADIAVLMQRRGATAARPGCAPERDIVGDKAREMARRLCQFEVAPV